MRRGEDEDKHELRDQIGCILVDDDGLSDNLAIVICTYFESHPDKPGSIEENPETGWTDWAVERTNKLLDKIVNELYPEHKNDD